MTSTIADCEINQRVNIIAVSYRRESKGKSTPLPRSSTHLESDSPNILTNRFIVFSADAHSPQSRSWLISASSITSVSFSGQTWWKYAGLTARGAGCEGGNGPPPIGPSNNAVIGITISRSKGLKSEPFEITCDWNTKLRMLSILLFERFGGWTKTHARFDAYAIW